MMERTEHLQWAKDRAMEYVRIGDLDQAWASFGSDMMKHPELRGHLGLMLGLSLFVGGQLDTAAEMTKFIEGFN